VRAPTTLGMFLRALKFVHVRQLDAVAARFLTGLTVHGGLIDAATLNYVDMDDTIRRTYGYAEQGSDTVPPASMGSMRCWQRSPRPAAAGDRGDQAVERVSELGQRRGPPGRRQSQNYEGVRGDRDGHPAGRRHLLRAADRRGRKDRAVTAAISSIPNKSWTKLPGAVFDEQLAQWVSDAEVAEIPFTAFASRGKASQVWANRPVTKGGRTLASHAL